jgi:hypothetical protein
MIKKKLLTDRTGNLEQNMLDEMGKRMSEEIDFEILCGMLTQIGWTKVILSPMTWETGSLIDLWVETNVKGNFETMGLVWIFENDKDAMWFKLKWLG